MFDVQFSFFDVRNYNAKRKLMPLFVLLFWQKSWCAVVYFYPQHVREQLANHTKELCILLILSTLFIERTPYFHS